MEKLTSILVIVNPHGEMYRTLNKALVLARRFGAKLELFLCDSQRAFALKHSYVTQEIEKSWRATAKPERAMDELEKDRQLCLADGLKYLDGLKESLRASDVQISVDVACHSPLYESILHKVRDNSPDLVIKTASGSHPMRRIRFDDNDWQLAQLCPVPLMLTQSRPWAASPRFAATVDVSEYEHGSLARRIVHTAHFLANGCDAQLDILYSEREPVSAAKHAERALALSQLASEHDVPPDHIRLLKGEAEEALPRFAAGQDYDVLVLGALTRRRGVAALMGTLTSKLVDSLDSDFVLVKPEDFAA